MRQQYLLQDNTDLESIRDYNPLGASQKLFSFANESCWVVQFTIGSDDEDAAKTLAIINQYVQENYKTITLEDGCSAYYSRRLYPVFSEFEYKLRKFLYLKSRLDQDKTYVQSIKELDKLDLGKIFELLFFDESFRANIKKDINNREPQFFSKADLLTLIDSTEENPIWDRLIGKDVIPALRTNYNEVRNYRNDVMHFHGIDTSKYKTIRKRLHDINAELDAAIVQIELTKDQLEQQPEFNKTIATAIQVQKAVSELTNAMQTALANYRLVSEIAANSPAIDQVKDSLAAIYEAQMSLPQFKQMQELSKRIREQWQYDAPVVRQFQQYMKGIEAYTAEHGNTSDIPQVLSPKSDNSEIPET